MSNAALNAHIMFGEPCGEDAGFDEIADWAGELLISKHSDIQRSEIKTIRVWVVVEEDRGMGVTLIKGYPTEKEAIENLRSNEWIDYVDVEFDDLLGFQFV